MSDKNSWVITQNKDKVEIRLKVNERVVCEVLDLRPEDAIVFASKINRVAHKADEWNNGKTQT